MISLFARQCETERVAKNLVSPLKILIVDDHEAVRSGLRTLLSSSTWVIAGEACDGLEAVEKVKSIRPDLVLMDISMPRMDGLAATRIIRQETPEAEVILVSQNDPQLVARQAREVGARGYVSKCELSHTLLPLVHSLSEDKYAAHLASDWSATRSHEREEVQSNHANSGVGLNTPAVEASSTPGPTATDCFAAGGGMAERMRKLDWAETPLGPIETWPQSLKTSISICLASRFPIVMYWGPEYVVLYNDAYSAILGTKHPWALGQRCRDCWAEIWDTIGPMLDGVVNSGQATWSDDLLLLLERRGYAEECYFSFSFSPIRVETGAVGGVFTAVIETTDRVIGERRLRTLRDLASRAVEAKSENDACRIAAETLAENLHDLPFTIFCEGSISEDKVRVLCTAGIEHDHSLCTSLGSPGSHVFECVQGVAQSRDSCELNDLGDCSDRIPEGSWEVAPESAIALPVGESGFDRAQGILLAAISPHKRLDESYRTFFKLVAHQIANILADARSHEEARKRAQALAELDRAKTVFFSNVSHEFRTPLALMLGPIEDMLAADAGLAPEQRQRLEVAHRNSMRLLKLVNTLLDFSRIEAGRMEACYEPTNLGQFTSELASVFRSAIERAGLRLIINCDELGELVFVDRELWEKIVFNLLSNALKFTLHGEIEISLRRANDAAELAVRDTGTGIPRQDLPHLFERFYRVKGAHGRTFEGSGIGLAFVQELAKLHGGTVRVESQENQGSRFVVNVPLGTNHLPADRLSTARILSSTSNSGEAYLQEALRWLPGDPQAPYEASLYSASVAANGVEGGRGVRILLVDDNADMREYVRRLLQPKYTVVAVADGLAALESARREHPDLILADVMMPHLDGFGLLRELRADEKLKSTPVILLSARAGEESRIEGLKSGADDYLVKPFSARELLARVASHLDIAKLRREAADTLRESEQRFRALVNASSYAVYRMNSDWSEMRQLDGRGFISDTGKPTKGWLNEYIHPDDQALVLRTIREAVRTKSMFQLEHRVRRTDGTLGWTYSRAVPLLDSAGQIVEWFGAASDVTARKEAEENYRKIAQRLDAEVRARTRELEHRSADVLRQSEQLRDLSQRLLRTQDEERRHIARELHDSAGQTLTVLGMSLAQLAHDVERPAPQALKQVEAANNLVQQLHQEIRTTSYLLHPPLLDESGLASALAWYIEGLAQRISIEIRLNIAGDFGRIPSDMELVVFRFVQESLTNIHRHSGAQRALIEVVRNGESVRVNVEDNGRGMSPEKLTEIQSGGFGVGIRGMRERIRQFQGTMKIESSPEGTRISVVIPLRAGDMVDTTTGSQPLEAAV